MNSYMLWWAISTILWILSLITFFICYKIDSDIGIKLSAICVNIFCLIMVILGICK